MILLLLVFLVFHARCAKIGIVVALSQCTGYTHPLLMYLSLQFKCAFLYLVCIQFWQEFCIDKHQQCNGMTLSNDTFLPNFHFIYHSRWMPRMMLENWCNISLWCSCPKNLFQKICKMGVMMFRTMLAQIQHHLWLINDISHNRHNRRWCTFSSRCT